jgi:hypothetical protein
MTTLQEELSSLYQKDFVKWLEETVCLLKSRNIANLDWEHLIEEIEGLGSEQRHKVDGYLLQLLLHLLLYRYWNSEREWSGNGWAIEIDNFRTQLEFLFESRTLFNYFIDRIEVVYPKAVRQVVLKSKLPRSTFPEKCPFTSQEILNDTFFPN